MTPETLEALILAPGDAWELRRAFADLDEKARAELLPAVLRLHRQLHNFKADEDASDRLKQLLAERGKASWKFHGAPENCKATLALLALGSLSTAKRYGFYPRGDERVLERILLDRRPNWINDWIVHELKRGFTAPDLPAIRAWVKAGVCRKPTVDGYYREFARHLMRTRSPGDKGEPVPPISRQLLDDPDLLEDVPGLFKAETTAFFADDWRKRSDASDYETWAQALAKLSADGPLDRAELLRLALDGLWLDMKRDYLAGLHSFYIQMSPTPQEMRQHQPDYRELLCHPVGHVAKFAIEMLATVENQGALDSRPLLREIPSVFAGESKGNAIAALKLIGRIAARCQGAEVSAALSAAAEALRHSNVDVQIKALAFLEANAHRLERPVFDLITELESFVSASNRSRLRALVGEAAGAEPARARVEQVPVAAAASEAYSPISGEITGQRILFADAELTPIASIDALIDAALHAVEVVDSPDEIELIVDAISRLAGQPPADFDRRVAPLLHRLQHGRTGYKGLGASEVGVGLAVIDLIASWARGQVVRTPSASSIPRDEDDAFVPMIAHLRDLAERAARKVGRPLLCAPTHKGGWIDPVVWVGRLRELEDVASLGHTMDFRLSLLRLAPDRRAEALSRAGSLPASTRRIAVFALGGEAVPEKGDRNAYAVWISAARCRAPLADWSPAFAPLGLEDAWPDGLRPAEYSWHPVHRAELRQNPSVKLSVLRSAVRCGRGEVKQDASGGLLVEPLTSGLDRLATDWSELPTAALCHEAKPKSYYYGGDLTASWVVKWLAYAWPQNPAAAQMKGASMLARKIDDESIILSPWFGFLQSLFQKNRPWGEAGHLLLCLGLVGRDADVKGLAVDALIEGIDGRVFDPRAFVEVMTRLCEGQWVKLNRLADGLLQVAQVSALHARVVSEALQAWLPLVDFKDRRALHVLEVLAETQAITRQPLSEPAQAALRGVYSSGKIAKLAKELRRAG
jgi:hypothetical protein